MNPNKRLFGWRELLGLLILVLSLALLLWSLWPLGVKTLVSPIAPDLLQLPTPEGFWSWQQVI